MLSKKESISVLLDRLKAVSNRFGEDAAFQKKTVLEALSKHERFSFKSLLHYHDVLLFLSAYPENQELMVYTKQELIRVSELIKKINKHQQTINPEQLDRSGLVYTKTQGAFSFELICWLCKTFPNQITLHSIDESGVHPQIILKNSLSALEFELAANDSLSPLNWLEQASGTKNKSSVLRWLISQFERMKIDDLTRDYLFDSLKVYIEISASDPLLSRTFGRGIFSDPFFHKESLLRKFDHIALLNTKISEKKKLNETEYKALISASRVALALLNRETDPITYCQPKQIEFFELERGLSIALFSINANRRLPLESYIGYMMFKNGLPMAYGGCWIFGKRALVGINIFEPFRGGESAYVFAQILRTYRQRFGIDYFEVEPYQFGKGNPEGIQSGAFWFYYRFGFRPLDAGLYKIAEREQHLIQNKKGYRTSFQTLKELTKSNIAWNISGIKQSPVNPAEISKQISNYIIEKYSGNRTKAEQEAFKETLNVLKIHSIKNWTSEEKQAFYHLSLWFVVQFKQEKLKVSVCRNLSALFLLKGSDEFAYIDLFRRLNLNF